MEAYWVLGIEAVDGHPLRLCFSHEQCPDGTPVSVFQAALAETYGQDVIDELERALKRASSYTLPEEVEADAEAFPGVPADASLPGEDLRHESDRPAET